MLRAFVLGVFGLSLTGAAASAQQLDADQAKAFVVGKTFAFTCFEGSVGAGSIKADGSATGTIRLRGSEPERNARIPTGTLRVEDGQICAQLPNATTRPCFTVVKTSATSFRGHMAGFEHLWCDFARARLRPEFSRRADASR